jgi:pyruvate dehydrogenase E2 component (dihydrolipoamide acetyltransferase)
MATKVHMEALSPTMEEGQLVKWLKQEGDAVNEGDVLAEIETDKATMELVARGSGVLQGVRLQEGATAAVGEVIAVIAAEGETTEADATGGEAEPAGAGAEEAEARGAGDAAPAGEAPARGREESRGSEQSGRPERQEAATPAAEGTGAPAAAGEAEPAEARVEEPREPRGEAGDGRGERGRVKASPLARRLAEESGVDLGSVEGTGPGGRITKRDIEAAARAGAPSGEAEPAPKAEARAEPAPKAEAREAPAGAPPAALVAADADAEKVPHTQMRKTIAKRLAQSIGPVPTFYLTIEVDMTRLMEVRRDVNARLEQDGAKASINDFIVKAVAAALARHPEVNAAWGDGAITRYHRVHVGVAVAVEDGLITPIVRDADRKRVRDIAAEVKELAARAREKKLKPEEYTGATFSISNLGMFGITEFTAIINPPESGIIAVGAVEEKPVVEDGAVVVRPRMRLTMSCDHRVVDGATGAKFLQTVRELVEEPLMIIA